MSDYNLGRPIRFGLIAGVIALSVSAIGMVQTFDERSIITDIFTLGQLLLFSAPVIAGYLAAASKDKELLRADRALLGGAITGFLTALPLLALILLATVIWPSIRDALVNVSPALIEILTFGRGVTTGSVILTLVMTALGIAGALFHLVPERIERPLFAGIIWTIGLGMLSEILLNVLRPWLPRDTIRIFFGSSGITPTAAIIVFVLATGIAAWWQAQGKERYARRRTNLTPQQEQRNRWALTIGAIGLLAVLPWILGIYLTEVVDIIGIFVLMGLGLNIVVGYAGLLDLGYVAFFAIGAYVMGLLTTEGALGIGGLSFWAALPFSVLASTTAGIMLGVPVLRMRGDYLAIVTLGFGEIIRVLATSDLLKPVIGGAQGILQITKPEILSFTFVQPQEFYYLILAGCLLAVFVSSRLRDARPGRRWMAMREDEDVAEAVGIHLVTTKLLAFAIGAAFAGLAGAIFASRLGSIFPHSFNLLISINVLCLIIVGGIGSLPGVVVGAAVLVGLPELLREFAEYRLLLYGALLIVTMLVRPEGLWPSPIRRRELHAEDEEAMREEPAVHPEQVHELV